MELKNETLQIPNETPENKNKRITVQKWKQPYSEPGTLIQMRIPSFYPSIPFPSAPEFYTVWWSAGVHYYRSQ